MKYFFLNLHKGKEKFKKCIKDYIFLNSRRLLPKSNVYLCNLKSTITQETGGNQKY